MSVQLFISPPRAVTSRQIKRPNTGTAPALSAPCSVFKHIPESKWTLVDLLCLRVEAEVKPGGGAAAELSEAAQAELLELCEDQFARLEKVNSCFHLTRPTGLCHQSLDVQVKYKPQIVSLCCSFRMRSYCVNRISVRIRKSR